MDLSSHRWDRFLRRRHRDDDDDALREILRRRPDRDERKEASLISLIYRAEQSEEITILEENRTVFKGCLQHGDRLTFKSRDDRATFSIYIDDRWVTDWKYPWRKNFLFELDSIWGSATVYSRTPVRERETPPKDVPRRQSSKIPIVVEQPKPMRREISSPPAEVRSIPVKTVKKSLSPPQPTAVKTPSEGFPADLSDVSESQTSNEEVNGHRVAPVLPPPPSKRTYGPPQLSSMLSVNEANESLLTTPIDHSEQTLGTFTRIPSNTQTPAPPALTVEASGSSMAEDATQALLTRLGIVRQQQVERPEASSLSGVRQKGNVEYFTLVYLNSSPLDEGEVKHLRAAVNYVKMFDDTDDCVAFINSVSNERILFVLSSEYSSAILPRIEDLQQVLTIYILSENDSSSFSHFSKVRGSYSTFDPIVEQISDDINKVTRDLITYTQISAVASDADATFIHSRLVNQVILKNEETNTALKELIDFAREEYQGNDEELRLIEEFQSDYQADRAIWWFTRPCFLSKMVNKALRTPEVDILYRLRLFIQHLHRQIDNESLRTSPDASLVIYLGQTIHRTDLGDLQTSLSQPTYLTFNQFLFGTTQLSLAIEIAKALPRATDEYVPVVLHLDLSSNSRWANSSSLRYVTDEDNDILLNIGLIGRIVRIERDEEVAAVHLKVVEQTSETSLQRLNDESHEELIEGTPLMALVKLMLAANQENRAEQFVEELFHDQSTRSDVHSQGALAAVCHAVGGACHGRNDFRRAIHFFKLSLETFLRFVPEDSAQLSPTYNNIGSMYFRLDEFDQSLEYHNKALQVQLQSSDPNLSSITSYSNNIGVVFLKQKKYPQAIQAFRRALKLLLQTNQPNNGDLPSTYDNLGDAFLLQGNLEQSLTHYTKALEIQRSIVPHNPQALASYNNSIGNVYNKLQRYSDALVHFQRTLEYQQEYLPAGHPSFASLYNNIGSMYYRQEQFDEALPFYMKSLEIELMCLPANHPTIAVTHFNIATTYTGLGRFDEAIASTQRSVEQLLKTLPADHEEVQENQAYIQVIERKRMLKGLFHSDSTTS